MDKSKRHLTILEIVLFGVLGALMFALQVVMGFLPNIEPVSLLVMVFAVVFGWKCLYPIYIFVIMEFLFYGIGIWNVYYLYIWTVLAVAAMVMKKNQSPMGWALLSAVYGLLFGALCAIADAFIGGIGFAAGKWVTGIPFDITHCAGNFVIGLVLFKPVRNLVDKLYAQMRRYK